MNFLPLSSAIVCVFTVELSPPVEEEGVELHPYSKKMMNKPMVVLNMMVILSQILKRVRINLLACLARSKCYFVGDRELLLALLEE